MVHPPTSMVHPPAPGRKAVLWGFPLIVIVLVILIRFIVARLVEDRIFMHTIWRRASDQSHQHGNNSNQYRLAWSSLSKLLFRHKHIQTGRAFQRRTPSDIEEPASIGGRVFAVPLGNIQRNGRCGPVKLIMHGQCLWKRCQEFFRPNDKLDRFLIDAQLLMVKTRIHDKDCTDARGVTQDRD